MVAEWRERAPASHRGFWHAANQARSLFILSSVRRSSNEQGVGITWNFLRPSNFMSNALWWLPSLKAKGVVQDPVGLGHCACIDTDDIAAVACQALERVIRSAEARPVERKSEGYQSTLGLTVMR